MNYRSASVRQRSSSSDEWTSAPQLRPEHLNATQQYQCHQELFFSGKVNQLMQKGRSHLTSIFNKVADLTCFIVVGGELLQHLPIHAEDALLQDAGVGQAALSLLPLQGLQLLLQGLWQVGLHVICCSLED